MMSHEERKITMLGSYFFKLRDVFIHFFSNKKTEIGIHFTKFSRSISIILEYYEYKTYTS